MEATPGTKWAYANHGYRLISEIIERIEGRELDDIMRTRIFGPLGMHDTYCLAERSPRLSTPYRRALPPETVAFLRTSGLVPPDDHVSPDDVNIRGAFPARRMQQTLGSGGVQSTMPDMQCYASALLRNGAGIVRAATFGSMVEPQWCPDRRLLGWGLGFQTDPGRGSPRFGHGGLSPGGWLTDLSIFPDVGLGIVQMSNVDAAEISRVAFPAIARSAIDKPKTEFARVPIEHAILDAAPGVYEALPGKLTNFRTTTAFGRIQLKRQGDELWLYARRGPARGGARLLPAGTDDPAFLVIDAPGEPAYVALTRDGAARVSDLRLGLLVHMVRAETVQPWV